MTFKYFLDIWKQYHHKNDGIGESEVVTDHNTHSINSNVEYIGKLTGMEQQGGEEAGNTGGRDLDTSKAYPGCLDEA